MISRLLKFSVTGLLASVLLVGAAVVTPLLAQTASGSTIEEIRVVGTQRIDPSTVNSYMQLKPGDRYNAEKVDESLKNLFNTGLFADVTLRREGRSLVVQVVENPIINRIAFEGNRKIDDETLQTEVSLRPRVVYTRTKVQSDVRRLLDVYRRTGRFAATVDPKVIQLSENRVDLVFEIDRVARQAFGQLILLAMRSSLTGICAMSFRPRNQISTISSHPTTRMILTVFRLIGSCCDGSIFRKGMRIFVWCRPSLN